MKNITYIFSQNRKKNHNNDEYAKDFYYGLHNFEKKDFNIEVIEYESTVSIFQPLFKFFDKFMNKFLSLPFSTAKLTNLKNFKKVLNTDYLFLVNEGVGFSSLFLIIFARPLKKINISVFVMGLYSKNLKLKSLNFLHFFFIKILVMYSNNIFFLGKSEFEQAKNIHSKYSNKFIFLPFCIDTEFWVNDKKKNIAKNENIIFVGNDGSRDFEIIKKLAFRLSDINFTIVSSNEILKDINLPNVKIYNGFWGSGNISDLEMKNLYLKAKLSIIPLKETYQPSGQSVALQSMALGIPVMITKTKGFWHKDLFFNDENIIFVESFDLEIWINKIKEYFYDESKALQISNSGKSTVLANYKLEHLYESLNKIISDVY